MPAIKFGNAASLLAAALALSSTSAVLAQEPPLEAQASRTATFDIPSQPLAQALTAFGRQSGMQIAVDTAAVAGKTSGSVNGTMTAEQALRQLLAGSGLTYQFTSANAVTVAGAAPGPGSSAVQLDPVRVQAAAPPAQAEIGNLPPPYAGGQVARGGKVGLLGNRDFMDTPFSETTYTEKYMQDQQARTLTDVLAGDPTVRLGWPNGNVFDDRVMIRGILVFEPQLRPGRSLRHRARPGGHDRHRTGRGVPRTVRLPERRPAERRRRHHQPGAQARDQRADHAGERSLPVRRPARRHRRCRPPLRSRPGDRPAGQRDLLPAAIRR